MIINTAWIQDQLCSTTEKPAIELINILKRSASPLNHHQHHHCHYHHHWYHHCHHCCHHHFCHYSCAFFSWAIWHGAGSLRFFPDSIHCKISRVYWDNLITIKFVTVSDCSLALQSFLMFPIRENPRSHSAV